MSEYTDMSKEEAKILLDGRSGYLRRQFPEREIVLPGESLPAQLRSLDLVRITCKTCGGTAKVENQYGASARCPECNRGKVSWRKAMQNKQLGELL